MKISDKIIAHRGASAYAPENTIAAFDKALAMGCHAIEFDVMCNEAGEPFVFHDDKLKRTTNGRGYFAQSSTDYLDTLDAGKWFSKKYSGEKIPRFLNALKWLSFSDVEANIEIKPAKGLTEQTTITTLRFINRYWPQNKPLPLVSSFDWETLTLCRSLAPELPIGLLLKRFDSDSLVRAQQISAYSIHLDQKHLKEAQVQEIKAHHYKLYAYTVNKKKQAIKLFNWGVDAVFSDYPDLLL